MNHISRPTLDKTSFRIDWEKIIGFRNIVAHEYFNIDYTIVYKIAIENVPVLKESVSDLIRQLES